MLIWHGNLAGIRYGVKGGFGQVYISDFLEYTHSVTLLCFSSCDLYSISLVSLVNLLRSFSLCVLGLRLCLQTLLHDK